MRKLLLPVCLVGLSVFLFFWYIQPTWAEIQDIQSQTQEYKTALANVSELQNQVEQKLLTRDQISAPKKQRLNTILPDTFDPVQFLIELDRLAEDSGMIVENVSFSGTPALRYISVVFSSLRSARTVGSTPGVSSIWYARWEPYTPGPISATENGSSTCVSRSANTFIRG